MKKNHSNEILLLVILAVILFGYVTMAYLVKPVKEQTENVNQMMTEKETEIKNTYYTVTSYQPKSESLSRLSGGLDEYADRFYSKDKQDEYLEHISLKVLDNDVSFTSMSALESYFKVAALFGDNTEAGPFYKFLEGDPVLGNAAIMKSDKFNAYYKKLQETGGRMETDLRITTMTVEADGHYSDILAFLKGITSEGRNIVCTSLTLDIAENINLKASDDPETRMVTTLVFVEVPKIEDYCNVKDPEPLPSYAFPQDIIDGSYRYSGGLLSAFSAAFS